MDSKADIDSSPKDFCDVEELKSILRASEDDPNLLKSIQLANARQRNKPTAHFTFPGTKGSMISLPPFHKWPIQLGWSFSTWLYLIPKPCGQPYLYNFKTSKSGLGYSAHFTGDCLVLTSIRVKGKGIQHCVAYEFPPNKWIHCAITYHNKWRASEIKVYINGQLAANIQMPWQVQTTETYDRCFIGGVGVATTKSTDNAVASDEINCFSGHMSAMYLFNEGLSPAQICAIHRLGPSYMGQFKYSNESYVNLPPQITKALYEEKLASTLFCLFTPVAVDSGTLCIQLAPFKSSTTASAQNYFISAPHAALSGQTKAIITQPINSILQSLGCSRSLLPLLDTFASKGDAEACSTLIYFLCDLLETSPYWFANDIVQNNGFIVVACSLATNPRVLLIEKLLDILISLTRTLLTTSTTTGDALLLKHLLDNILFNPSLWIYADTKLQIKLYSYLATEFLHGTRNTSNKYTITNSSSGNSYVPYNPTTNTAAALSSYSRDDSNDYDTQPKSITIENTSSIVSNLIFGEVRRVSTVLQSLHALKYYYWITEEKNINSKARNHKLRPSQQELLTIRSHILNFTKELICRSNTIPSDEIQGLLNYLSSCSHSQNLLDVLDLLSSLLEMDAPQIVSALDQKQGVKVLFILIGSQYESVRIKALKLLGSFLANCSLKKKHENMNPNNLFMLLCDKLSVHKPMTIEVYEALIDILLETNESRDFRKQRSDPHLKDVPKWRIENSVIIKVIATLLHNERIHTPKTTDDNPNSSQDIRKLFINDLWNLIVSSKENRRIILQMSVWQHWLINLIDNTISDSQLVMDQILAIFRVLLYHAIRYEFGGWRVWIDTLAILHTKVSYDEFCQQLYASDSLSRLPTHSYEEQFNHENFSSSKKSMTKEMDEKEIPKVVNVNNDNHDTVDAPTDDTSEPKQPAVSSISETVPRGNTGIQMDDEDNDHIKSNDEQDSKVEDNLEKSTETDEVDSAVNEGSIDTVDLAPSREFRKLSLKRSDENTHIEPDLKDGSETSHAENISQQSMTSIPLEEPSSHDSDTVDNNQDEEDDGEIKSNDRTPESIKEQNPEVKCGHQTETDAIEQDDAAVSKITASPAFRIPEFKWGSVIIKLLNDIMFSIECDLYHWRCLAKCTNLEMLPFTPKTAATAQAPNNATNQSKTNLPASLKIETILQKPENQIYIINIIHFVSQLSDNIIIASGGLLPLLADATGGPQSGSATTSNEVNSSKVVTCEGLTCAQANSILYRLVNIIDIVIFAASHINLAELEADKNTTNGGILRQCLRLACTVTVKNCLVVRSIHNKIASMGIGGSYVISASDFPKDMFDGYHGCSLLSANGLFECPASALENSDLIANVEYSPNQTPNTSTMPSLLPFQPAPIRDPNKLLQLIDISRMQACIYHNVSTESRQSQFLALSSLYFISVLMVSKYRDIIEPKQRIYQDKMKNTSSDQKNNDVNPLKKSDTTTSVSSVESNLLNFGKMQPNSSSSTPSNVNSTSALTDMLTAKLETTLDTICPLLKSIMCDFCSFLSKTLVGSHGQDLVNKEADRTFKRTNTSPVELVMLLCSQEWQNTLQKNAGLAFIELINEGRVLSHGMKDHIVRVAMEAEFILSRLRADDVAKHEHFNVLCADTQSARLHEEMLINSLISSAARRDYLLYCKFKESVLSEKKRFYKLDVWEDDDRRKRKFVVDSWDDNHQNLYSNNNVAISDDMQHSSNDTKRMLELQQKIDKGIMGDHTNASQEGNLSHQVNRYKEDEWCEEDYDEEADEEHHHNDSNSPDSENDRRQHKCNDNNHPKNGFFNYDHESTASALDKQVIKSQNLYGNNKHKDMDTQSQAGSEVKGGQMWDFDECSSVNDFAGSVVFATECSFIWSIYAIQGVLQLTNHELHFEPSQNITELIDMMKRENINNLSKDTDNEEMCSLKSNRNSRLHHDSPPSNDNSTMRKLDLKVIRYCEFLLCNGKVLLNDIRAIFSRHYLLQPHALEIFLAQRTSVMFAFQDFDTVRKLVKYLPPVGVGIKYGIPQTRRASLMTPRQLFAASNMTQKWQKREIGNFQYLMFLNTIAGRTYQDLNQYPVFPWILTNYESEELDLNLPTNFRDLSKPVGALNNKRRAEFIERYQSWDNPKVPAFHYGTHYSTAAFTLNWLCRLRGSLNSAYLALQDGKYEESSRLFLSIGDSWVSSLVSGQQNVKELIPEFFYLPEMFRANLGLPEVEFPPWAKTAEQFVRIHRLALESELVSCQLHQWIDLIFGYKQRGPEAVNAVNTFYYLTYQGNVNLNMVQDPSLRDAIETQIKHFGQTPSQLSTEPHPPRFGALHVAPLMFSPTLDEISRIVKFPFNNPIVHISTCISNYAMIGSDNTSPGSIANSTASNSISSIITITNNNQYQIHKWSPTENASNPFIVDPQLDQSTRRQLIDVDDIYSKILIKLANSNTPSQEDFLDEVSWTCAHYVTTLDSRYIIVGSFYDNSFRVFSTENGNLCQVIYGHRGPITCMTRSDGNAAADFYLATGSQDCSLLLWTWNERYAQVEGSGVSAVHNPLPKLTITGHQTAVLSVHICAELGLIISGSKNLILVNTTTNGENLLEIDVHLPNILDKASLYSIERSDTIMLRPQVRDKQKALLEASMLGDDIDKNPKEHNVGDKVVADDNKDSNSTRTLSITSSNAGERFASLKALCKSDYYITNLQLARELAFIVCVALPPPPKKRFKFVANSSDSPDLSNNNIIRNTAALLMTFNMKGQLMDSTTIGQAVNSPKLGDVCILQTTRDGEHLILNDSPTTIKIYRTSDLLPVYAYNTNDIPNSPSGDQNRVRSIAMLDHKFILVGLENGKIIVYNANFKNM